MTDFDDVDDLRNKRDIEGLNAIIRKIRLQQATYGTLNEPIALGWKLKAAEKALKALHGDLGRDTQGHKPTYRKRQESKSGKRTIPIDDIRPDMTCLLNFYAGLKIHIMQYMDMKKDGIESTALHRSIDTYVAEIKKRESTLLKKLGQDENWRENLPSLARKINNNRESEIFSERNIKTMEELVPYELPETIDDIAALYTKIYKLEVKTTAKKVVSGIEKKHATRLEELQKQYEKLAKQHEDGKIGDPEYYTQIIPILTEIGKKRAEEGYVADTTTRAGEEDLGIKLAALEETWRVFNDEYSKGEKDRFYYRKLHGFEEDFKKITKKLGIPSLTPRDEKPRDDYDKSSIQTKRQKPTLSQKDRKSLKGLYDINEGNLRIHTTQIKGHIKSPAKESGRLESVLEGDYTKETAITSKNEENVLYLMNGKKTLIKLTTNEGAHVPEYLVNSLKYDLEQLIQIGKQLGYEKPQIDGSIRKIIDS